MRRRPSNSGAEEDYEDCIPLEIHPLADDDGEPTNGYLNCSTPTFAARKSQELDRRKLESPRVPAGMSGSNSWKLLSPSPNGNREKTLGKIVPLPQEISIEHMAACRITHHSRMRSPWRISLSSLMITTCSIVLLSAIVQSWLSRQLDSKGCQVPSMRPAYAKLEDFDTEHTRFASKYSVYLYREGVIDEDPKVKGVPVLFIPGNAGSYRQVRSLASEAAYYYHDILQHNSNALKAGAQRLDFFTADFNEDITAFHGQTLMDQAEYLNEAVAYILSLYHDPAKSERDPSLPDPSSVILLGHSMGGIVARAMLTMPNYQSNSINTIITMSAPHVRPPVSFDADIVGIYKQINDYWRQAYSHQWANNNPLWHVTLISIAGGGLDRMVPSDYTSVSSLVPDTHGFTVFTSSIPNVWTGMEHDTIVWCDQLRKIMIRALMEVVDVRRPGQTKQRNERMRVFRKTLLTGMEEDAEKVALQEDPTTLLTLEDNSNPIIPQGERFTLKTLGQSQKPQAYLLPIPSMREFIPQRFTLISNVNLDSSSDGSKLEVLFCSVFPLQHGQSATLFSMNVDLSGNTSGSTRLACKNAALDVIRLPASVQTSRHPFDQTPPFSYLQYEIEDIAEHQFVAIVDKASDPTPGWVIAEFSNKDKSIIRADISLQRLMTRGFHISLPSDRPLSTEIVIPSLRSGLLSYKLTVSRSWNDAKPELFAPLLRQYTSDPYESKYFVNINEADINFHGVAPYIPSSMKVRAMKDGITLQFWSDPNGNATFDISLTLDIPGSLGKLVLRYRTILFAFPLLIVSLVLRQQFIIYDKTGRCVNPDVGSCN
ncbi:MAG: GPI inositol deacylase [Trizodia sp. TS-e1964]|nr:MAG: GPI inositol deacylase [Trizodia sp. TS-e1964]